MSLLKRKTKTVTISRQTVTKDAAGGATKAYTTGARGSLPTSLKMRVMQPIARERAAYAQLDVKTTVILVSDTDPQVDTRDQITFDGRTMDVLNQRNAQEMSDFWTVECHESDRAVR